MCESCGIGTPEGREARRQQRRQYEKRIFGVDFMTKVAEEAKKAANIEKYGTDAEYEMAMKMATDSEPLFGWHTYWEDSEITVIPPGDRVFVVWYDPKFIKGPIDGCPHCETKERSMMSQVKMALMKECMRKGV